MSMKEAYEKKLQSQLDEWDIEIGKLKDKVDNAKKEAQLTQNKAQLEYYKQLEELRSMQDIANKKLTEMKNAGEDTWEDLKAGVENAWDSLGSALKSATSKFK